MPTPQEQALLERIALLTGANKNPNKITDIERPVTPMQPMWTPPVGAAVASGQERVPANEPAAAPSEKVQQQPISPVEMYYNQMAQAAAQRDALTKPLLEDQARGVSDLQNEIETYKNQPKKLDLTPLLAWADSFGNNSKLASSYTAPLSDLARQEKVVQLKEALQKSRGDLTAKQIQALNDRMQGQGWRAQGMQARLDNSQQAAAGKVAEKYSSDPVLKNSDNQQASLDKGLGLIKMVKDPTIPVEKKLIFSNQLKSELENDYARALSGSSNFALGSQERIELDTMNGKMAKILSYLNNSQQDINSPEYLNQLENSFVALKNEISDIQNRRHDLLDKRYSTAYSGNKFVQDVIRENKKAYTHNPVESSVGAPATGLSPEKQKRLEELRAKQKQGNLK